MARHVIAAVDELPPGTRKFLEIDGRPITDLEFHIPSSFFLSTALQVVTMPDFVAGILKTPFFGAIIALVGCHFGMSTKGGTVGVGNSTTRSVVTISIAILIADFFLTKIGILLWPNV